jgi:hypothetical protein
MGASGFNAGQYYLDATDAWTTVTGPGAGTSFCGRWPLNGYLFAVGNDSPSTTTQKYNESSGVWSSVASAITARRTHAAGFNGGMLQSGSVSSNTSTSEVYQEAGNYWKACGTMVLGAGSMAAFTIGGAVYNAGGHNGSPLTNTQKLSSAVKAAVIGLALEVK